MLQQALRAGDVGKIGGALVREDGIGFYPELLRALDLGIPVRPLHQPDAYPVSASGDARARDIEHGADTLERVRPVGLNRDPKTAPGKEVRVRGEGSEHVELEQR